MKLGLLLALLTLSCNAFAGDKYVCSNAKAERTIEVVYKSLDSKVPCEVEYKKPNTTAKVLWQADKEAGYCEAKAKAFAAKQATFGWKCTASQ